MINSGNKKVKPILYERYKTLPFHILRIKKIIFKDSEYKDIMQYGYLCISIAIKKYDVTRNCKFKTYLYNIMLKSFLQLFTTKNKYRLKETDISDIMEDGDSSFMDYLMNKNISKNLHREINENIYEQQEAKDILELMKIYLTENEYNCIISKYKGYSYNEISKMYGIPKKQIDNTIQNVRKKKIKYLIPE